MKTILFFRLRFILAAAITLSGVSFTLGESTVLRNDVYELMPQADGSFTVKWRDGGEPFVFRPRFIAWYQPQELTLTSVKWTRPVYNLLGWKLADGRVEHDLYRAGETIVLDRPQTAIADGRLCWTFADPRIELEAEVSLPAGKADPRVRYTFTAKQPGFWSISFAGAPEADLADVVELFQPLVWNGRRLPEACFLIPDDQCSIPSCLVETEQGTVGVIADPRQFPFEMPSHLVRRFGVAVRNAAGRAQPLCFTPLPGFKDSKLAAGEKRTYDVVLVARPEPLSRTFEHVARNVGGFRDRRENTVATLNQALDRMLEFAQGPSGNFDPENKAFAYPDSAGTVKNVSSLHPIGLATVSDDADLFRNQGKPILEYLLSREKFLFALSEEATKSSQTPSRKMAGPAMPVSELAALDRLSLGQSPYFRNAAESLSGIDRMLNMEWISRGDSWQNDLWLYRATRDRRLLEKAVANADRYLAERIDRAPIDFSEARTGTFFEYMLPAWKELYELYLDTREPRHLAAAHAGARQYAQLVWFYPAVPDGDVTVNESGFAPRRGNLTQPGLIPVAKATIPAWRVSEQGLVCEGNGTVQRIALFLATHAPWFMRIGHDADDEFLRAIARSAMVGRFANFPGYHFNTKYSTVHELADFPLRPYDELKPTTSMHYNHSLPMANLVLDYLMADAYARSNAKIDFSGEFAECYAFMQSRVYGGKGKFYDIDDARPWMPRGLVESDNGQVNYVAARSDDRLCLAFFNECDRPLEKVTFRLDAKRFASPLTETYRARVWHDGKPATTPIEVRDGRATIAISPKGLTAVVIEGLLPRVEFQDKFFTPLKARAVRASGGFDVPGGEAKAMILPFGPEDTWLYVYLTTRDHLLKSASLHVDIDGERRVFTDTQYPYEFSVPLVGGAERLEFAVEGVYASGGRIERSAVQMWSSKR